MKIFKRLILIIIVVIIAVFLLFITGKAILKMLFPIQHLEAVSEASQAFDLDPYLVLSLIKAESNFVSDAESGKGAVGLMQITESTGEWIAEKLSIENYGITRLKEPQTNIYMGCWYLAYLLQKHNGDETLALCSYNAGGGNVDKWLADIDLSPDGKKLQHIPFEETEIYVKKINQFKQIYRYLYPDIHF